MARHGVTERNVDWTDTDLWKRTLGARKRSKSQQQAVETLRSCFYAFRENAEILAARIEAELPSLTDHSVKHLDALWDIASILAGAIEFNPLEAFVFGGAVLLHDLANCVAAFPDGLNGLKGPRWNDLLYAHYRRQIGRSPTEEELRQPDQTLLPEILLQLFREIHAERAVALAKHPFLKHPRAVGSFEQIYLLDNRLLRESLGSLIGEIATSHHWPASTVEAKFHKQTQPSPAGFPSDWKIDVLKVALLLRLADAVQIDSRRAPTFALALRDPKGISYLHWNFQNKLKRPIVANGYLVYYSSSPFKFEDADSWWLCLEALGQIHRELSAADEILSRCRSFRFAARGVDGHVSPQTVMQTVTVEGWSPIDARIQIGDVLGVIRRFGGDQLYGENPSVVLRELLANAADAIRARRIFEKRPPEWGEIIVSLGQDPAGDTWLEVADNGIGMTQAVLSGALLDFGASYWESSLVRDERAGLLADGFESTGKFGIGFFSSFMLGNRVRVVSRPASRHGHSDNPCLALEFRGSSPNRGFIRQAATDEEFPDPGTRVRIWLREQPPDKQKLLQRNRNHPDFWTALDTLFGESSGRRRENPVELLRTLIGQTAPTLDVNVDLQLEFPDVEKHRSRVLEARDWLTIPFAQLLQRLPQSFFRSGEILSNTEEVLYVERRPVARLAVSSGFDPSADLTIGGFASHAAATGFVGVLIGTSPNLTRYSGEPIITEEVFRNWLTRIECSLGHAPLGFGRAVWYANFFLRYELRPMQIPCFFFRQSVLNFDQLASAELPDCVTIVVNEDFCWGLPNGDTDDVSFGKAVEGGDFELESDVIVAPAVNSSYPEENRIAWPRCKNATLLRGQSTDRDVFPSGLPALAIEAVAKNWGIDCREIIASGPSEQDDAVLSEDYDIEIGTYLGAPILVHALMLRKPSNRPKAN
jgi:hypothetical protein